MSMPASLIGFAFFKTLSKHIDLPFTPVENVLVQTVAGSMGTMPLGCGFVGVMPALNYMLSPDEHGPIFLSLWKLILWALGLCFFGVVFAVPLRRQVIIKEKLRFPSGTATALMIGVLHGSEQTETLRYDGVRAAEDPDDGRGRVPETLSDERARSSHELIDADAESIGTDQRGDWKARVKLLAISFAISGLYTLATYFFPILRNLPIFGFTLAQDWLWTLNPSLAYVGQGIIMGPATTIHMLLGAIVGWGILSPLSKKKGWASGPIDDWESGSKGWIVWISLAIMLADSIISLGYIASQSLWQSIRPYVFDIQQSVRQGRWADVLHPRKAATDYVPISSRERSIERSNSHSPLRIETTKDLPDVDAPQEHLVSTRTVWIGLVASIIFCIFSIRVVFGALVPLYATIVAVLMALVLSIMGVRALGETDLNPVSGISKLAQLFFALIIPQSNKNSVLINLIAGAVSEAGALQAGDLMQGPLNSLHF
jgi:OPT family oligopeptide transporter